MPVLQVTAEQIHSIASAEQLVDLLRKLLHAEARSKDIARRGVDVPAQITVSDKGEDGRVEWQGGPEQTDYLPARLSMFQCKATKMPRGECAREVVDNSGILKSAIREVLESNGSYIVFSIDKCRPYMLRERREGIQNGIAEATGGEFPDALVDFYDANKISDWVNVHPSVAVWALSELFQRPVGPLQSWESWRRNPDLQADRYTFVLGASEDGSVDLHATMAEVRAYLASPRSVARIVGLSGLGKTRVALETFRSDAEEKSPVVEGESASVIYVNADVGHSYLAQLLHALRVEGADAIFVVDDCDIGLHRTLARIVQHSESGLSLLTLDYDPTKVDGDLRYVELKRLSAETITSILKQAYGGLSDSEVSRICRFAQGFPKMAVLLGDAALAEEGRVATLRDDDVLRRLVWGRGQIDEVGQRVLAACSLFDVVGVSGSRRPELEFIARHLCSVRWERCYEWVQRFQQRQLIQRRGDFVQVLPKPLALRLAGERWEQVHPDTAHEWFGGVMPERLLEALCDQLALLDFHPSAQALVDKLCGAKGPFGRPDVLNTKTGSRCFRSLAEANPDAAMRALTRAFGSWSTEELLTIEQGRRNLIWALEKLCFRRNTFAEAARLLLAFAAAENESWANNATEQFVQLYQLHLSGTEATGEEKLAIIDGALASDDPRTVNLAIRALAHGLTTYHFSRLGGAEAQGSGKPLVDWQPSRGEAYEYYRAVFTRLTTIASSTGQHAATARQEIPPNLRGLIGFGLVDDIDAAISSISAAHGAYWPEALGSVADTLHFDRDQLRPEVIEKVEALYDRLLPKSLEDRLRFYVTDLPWGFLRRGDAEGDEERPVRELADECAQRPRFVVEKLPDLLTASQRQFFSFGKRLGEVFPEPEEFIHAALDVLEQDERPDANSALLGAFLNGLESSRPDLVEKTLTAAATRRGLHRYLVDLTRFITISPSDVRRVAIALRAGQISHGAVRALSFGSVLSNVPASDIDDLMDALRQLGDEALWTALEIIYYYSYRNSDHYTSIRPRIVQFLLEPGILVGGMRTNSECHHFEVLASKALGDGEESDVLARHLAREILELSRQRRFPYHLDHLIRVLLDAILVHHLSTVWPIFEDAIASADPIVRFHLEKMLGSGTRIGEKLGPIFRLQNEFLLDWCRRQPDSAPAFLTGIAPLLLRSDDGTSNWTPLIVALINEFGDREDVLAALSGNIHSFFVAGSLVAYYEQYQAPLESLLSHRRKAVRAFARHQLEGIKESIHRETKRDEEQEFGIY